MPKFDAEISWSESYRLVPCVCQHNEQSHRPMSRKCSLCACTEFVAQQKGVEAVK